MTFRITNVLQRSHLPALHRRRAARLGLAPLDRRHQSRRRKQLIARTPNGDAADVALAVAAARRAFDDGPWKDVTAQERGRILFRLAADRARPCRRVGRARDANNGKPIVERSSTSPTSRRASSTMAASRRRSTATCIPVPDNAMSLALREPIGVAGQIIPWNYPLLMAAWKLAPAICAGCTMVLKPAEQTPLTVLELAKHFEAAGFRPASSTSSPASATGGRRDRRAPGRRQDRVHRQRRGRQDHHARGGGHAEEDLARARRKIAEHPLRRRRFRGERRRRAVRPLHQPGRSLLGGEPHSRRALDLHASLDAMVEKAKRIRLGPGIDRATKMGPLVSQEQFDRVRDYQEIGAARRSWRSAVGGAPVAISTAGCSSSRRSSTTSTTRAHRARGNLRAGGRR